MLELLVVNGDIVLSVVSYRSVSSRIKSGNELGLKSAVDVRELPVVLNLVFEPCELLDDLLALRALVGIVALRHTSVSVINNLRLAVHRR